jgi:hypothetical protein
MRVGASRTAPDLTITAPHRSALAPAAQPRPASPRRALPSARVSKRVPIPCKSGVPVQCSLTLKDRPSIRAPRSASAIEAFNGPASRSARSKPARAVARAKRLSLGTRFSPTSRRRRWPDARASQTAVEVAGVPKTLPDEMRPRRRTSGMLLSPPRDQAGNRPPQQTMISRGLGPPIDPPRPAKSAQSACPPRRLAK